MQRFAQISDPHLSTLAGVQWRELLSKRLLGYLSWRRKRRFEHRQEILEALRRDLGRTPLAQLLVTGDLTHIGLPQEFAQARSWLERLGDPRQVAVVPGNHDAYVASDWRETFARWAEYMAPDGADGAVPAFPSLRVRGETAFIGLSTACPKPPFLATGTAGAAQLARLPALLAESARAGLFRVVYLHHPPLPGQEAWRKRLTDAAAVRALLVEHGVELVLWGHSHRAFRGELATRHGPAALVAVPSASTRGRHGNDVAGYNCYTVARSGGGWHLEIETRRYRAASGGFVDGGKTALALPRAL
jgi:3',5'-cyclic AMP phosphodiesterase CpdA